MAKGQGIESQISHMNHQAAVNAEYDAAVLGEDHYTAKNMEQDAAFLGIKARVDAGFHDTIYDELVTPIEKMSPQEFATTYGYENMTEQQIRDRQSNVVKQAKSKIQDTVDAIKFADNNRTFNLGTEEGRLNRDMLIYSIATNKSVGDRIDGLTKTVSDNIKGRLQKYTFDESQYDKATESELDKIEKLEASKEGKSKEEISAIDSKINARRSIIENHANAKEQTIRAKEILSQIEDGGYNAMTVQEARDAQSVISRLFEAKKRHSHDNRTNEVLNIDEEKVRNETMTALDDLVKLNRRKEEALELYSLTKDPSRWSDFYKTERIGKRIEKMMLESNDKIIQSQNEEVETAKAHVDADPEATPEEISSKTGAELGNSRKLKYIKDSKKISLLQQRETAALEHINRIEALRNNMAEIKFDENNIVIIDGVKYSMNYNNGKLDSISEINNPRVKIRNPLLLDRIKAKIFSNSFNEEEISSSDYTLAKEENPELKKIEAIYKNLINDKIAQSMYALYEKKKLSRIEIDTLYSWIIRSRGEISVLQNAEGNNEIIKNALENLDLIELMVNDKIKELNEREADKKSSTTKLTKGQIIESQKEEEY
jgi:hypothetical protein